MKFISLVIFITLISLSGYSQNYTTRNCKDKTIERVRKHCVCKDIEKYVNSKFNVSSVFTSAKPGVNRIYSRFKINSEGQITNIQVKGFSTELEKETIRALKSFPDIIPASLVSDTMPISEDFYNILVKFEIRNTVTNL